MVPRTFPLVRGEDRSAHLWKEKKERGLGTARPSVAETDLRHCDPLPERWGYLRLAVALWLPGERYKAEIEVQGEADGQGLRSMAH